MPLRLTTSVSRSSRVLPMTNPSSVVGERAAGCDPGGLVALGQRIQRGERRARGRQNEIGVSAGTEGALHRLDVRVEAA